QLDAGMSLGGIIKAKLARGHKGRPGTGKQRDIALLPGYGRPVAKADERIPALMEVVRRYGQDRGRIVTLAFDLEKHLQELELPFRLNSGGLIAALCADQGMNAQQLYYYVSHCFYASLAACNADALHHPVGSFFPVKCNRIEYLGVAERKWREN